MEGPPAGYDARHLELLSSLIRILYWEDTP
jgi:hypothetical protein